MSGQIRTLGRSSLIYGLGTTLTRFIGLLLLPFFTSYLTPADYGVLTILALVNQVALSVFSLGLGAGMGPSYFDGDNEQQKATTVWTTFALLVASGLVEMAIALVISDDLSLMIFGTEDLAPLVLMTFAGVAISQLATPFMQRLQFDNRATLYVVLSVVSVLATIGMSVFLVAVFSLGVRGMVIGQVFGYGVGTVTALYWAGRGLRFRVSRTIGSELLRLGLPLMPGFAFILVQMHGNKYVLQELQGLDAVGIYGLGFNLGMASAVLIGAVQAAWYPYFMSYMSRQEEAQELFGRIFTYYSVGVGAVVLLFYVFAQPVVHILTNAAFYDAYRVIGLVATAQYFNGMFSLLLPALYFAREVASVSVAQGAAAAVVIGLSVLLIPSLSYFGAALALAVATGCMVLVMFAWQRWRGTRYLIVRYEYARLLRFFAFFVVCAAALLLPYPFSWTSQVIIVPAALTIITAIVYWTLSAHERLALRDTMLGRFLSGPTERSA